MQKYHLSNHVQCNMDGQTWMLLLIVFTFKGNSELSHRNTLCPSVCICDGKTAICKGHDGSHLRYIPPLPENITSLVFNSNDLGYMGEKAFNNLSNLHLTRLDLRRSRIGFIHKKGLQTDSSSTVSRLKWKQILSFQKTTQYIYGLQNSSLREIRLIDMWYSNLSNDFFSYLNNTSLERIFFDNNRIIASNIGDVLSPLSKHLREISLKAT